MHGGGKSRCPSKSGGRAAVALAAALLLFAVRPADAASSPVLYLFAHEDDEIFVLERMRQDVEAGRQVVPVWITDGSKVGHPEEREKESRAVMARVGVPADNLRFLGFPDHESVEYLAAIHQAVRRVREESGCEELVSPAYEGGNIDHDTAAFIAAMVRRDSGDTVTHFEFPLYNHQNGHRRVNEFLPRPDAEVHYVSLEGEGRQLLRESLRLYGSQRILLMMLELSGHKKLLLERGEPIRRAVDYNFLARPSDEACGYEVSGLHRATFEEWSSAVGTFLQLHTAGP